MAERRFRLVDVFGEDALFGNPLAVVVDTEGLETGEMLDLTRWLGFSETTFISDPEMDGADYKVRIFTLNGELPFAGHPTLGTCHVWRSISGHVGDKVVQECGVGLVPLSVDEQLYRFRAPDLIRSGPIEEPVIQGITDVLGVDASEVLASRWVDNGPGWAGVLLPSAERVLEIRPDFSMSPYGELPPIGLAGFYPDDSVLRYEVRALFTDHLGTPREDPVTGSLNASLAQWLIESGRAVAPYVASQGTVVGRRGRIHISTDAGGDVWVGGRVFDVVAGAMPQ